MFPFRSSAFSSQRRAAAGLVRTSLWWKNVIDVNKKPPTVNDHIAECHSKLQALWKNIERIRSEIQCVLAAILTLHLSHIIHMPVLGEIKHVCSWATAPGTSFTNAEVSWWCPIHRHSQAFIACQQHTTATTATAAPREVTRYSWPGWARSNGGCKRRQSLTCKPSPCAWIQPYWHIECVVNQRRLFFFFFFPWLPVTESGCMLDSQLQIFQQSWKMKMTRLCQSSSFCHHWSLGFLACKILFELL